MSAVNTRIETEMDFYGLLNNIFLSRNCDLPISLFTNTLVIAFEKNLFVAFHIQVNLKSEIWSPVVLLYINQALRMQGKIYNL